MSMPTTHPLELLRRQYFSLVPPYCLTLPPPEILASETNQLFLIQQFLDDPKFQEIQPHTTYQRLFWRKLVGQIEIGVEKLHVLDDDAEVHERLYETLASLMAVPTDRDSSNLPPSYRSFIYDIPSWASTSSSSSRSTTNKVTLLEEQVVLQAGTTGLRTWTAALHLAHHILTDTSILNPPAQSHNKEALPPILELGAGTGFLSILLAQLGGYIISTDLDSEPNVVSQTPLVRLRENTLLNPMDHPPRVEALDWMDAGKPSSERPSIWSKLLDLDIPKRTIVAADVIYDPDLVPPLVTALVTLLSPTALDSRSSSAVIAATVRNPSTLKLFISTCEEKGLSVEMLDLERMNPMAPTFWDGGLDRDVPVQIMRIVPFPS